MSTNNTYQKLERKSEEGNSQVNVGFYYNN